MISYIIPVFNGEKLIGECIDYIKKNTMVPYEIIIIDDGSTDKTHEECYKLMKDDKNIRYFYQKNSGVSAARNKGIELAKKSWIIFVDVDDILSFGEEVPSFRTDADIIVFSGKLTTTTVELWDNEQLKEYAKGILKCSNNIDFNNAYLNAVWSKAYKTELLKKGHIRFNTKLVNGEDSIFNLNVLSYANKILLDGHSVYKWRVAAGSATHRFQQKIVETDRIFQDELKRNLETLGIYPELRKICNRIALEGLWIILFQNVGHYLNNISMNKKFRQYLEIKNSTPYKEAYKEYLDKKIFVSKQKKLMFFLLNKYTYYLSMLAFKFATKGKTKIKEKIISI